MLKTGAITHTHALAKHPQTLAINPVTHTVVAAAKDGDRIALLDLTTQTLTPNRWIDPMGLAPSWVGPAGAVIGTTGGALAALGLATGNPIAAGLGLGLAAVGGGLTLWDWATTPLEQIEDAQKRLEPIKEDLRRIEELLEKERGDKIKPEGACP